MLSSVFSPIADHLSSPYFRISSEHFNLLCPPTSSPHPIFFEQRHCWLMPLHHSGPLSQTFLLVNIEIQFLKSYHFPVKKNNRDESRFNDTYDVYLYSQADLFFQIWIDEASPKQTIRIMAGWYYFAIMHWEASTRKVVSSANRVVIWVYDAILQWPSLAPDHEGEVSWPAIACRRTEEWLVEA